MAVNEVEAIGVGHALANYIEKAIWKTLEDLESKVRRVSGAKACARLFYEIVPDVDIVLHCKSGETLYCYGRLVQTVRDLSEIVSLARDYTTDANPALSKELDNLTNALHNILSSLTVAYDECRNKSTNLQEFEVCLRQAMKEEHKKLVKILHEYAIIFQRLAQLP